MFFKKRIKEVSYGIIPIFINKNDEEEFLLIKDYSNVWLFPKGHKECGENFVETAKRELFEETSLVCNKIYEERFFTESHVFYRNDVKIYKTSHYYIGIVKDKEVILQKEEVKDYYWGRKEEIFIKINFKNIKKLFKEALVYIDKFV